MKRLEALVVVARLLYAWEPAISGGGGGGGGRKRRRRRKEDRIQWEVREDEIERDCGAGGGG